MTHPIKSFLWEHPSNLKILLLNPCLFVIILSAFKSSYAHYLTSLKPLKPTQSHHTLQQLFDLNNCINSHQKSKTTNTLSTKKSLPSPNKAHLHLFLCVCVCIKSFIPPPSLDSSPDAHIRSICTIICKRGTGLVLFYCEMQTCYWSRVVYGSDEERKEMLYTVKVSLSAWLRSDLKELLVFDRDYTLSRSCCMQDWSFYFKEIDVETKRFEFTIT